MSLHHHHDGHDHGHGHREHTHAAAPRTHAFVIGMTLNAGFVLAEAIFGFASNSLALLSDAGHNLSDVFALLLSWMALRLSNSAPTRHRTYGWRRASILAALINAVLLLIAVGVIGWEAVRRLSQPQPVAGTVVIWVAAAGVVVNSLSALLFMRGREHDLNIRSAYLHLVADAALSLAVVATGVMIRFTGWLWLDPVVSLALAATIAFGTRGLLRDAINLFMDAVPTHIDPHAVETYLSGLANVSALHDLHIWAMSTNEVAATVHLVMQPIPDDDRFLQSLAAELRSRFGIHHVTVQIEHGNTNTRCAQAPAHAV